MPSLPKKLVAASLLLIAGLGIGAGCSSSGDGGTEPGSISLAISPTSASIAVGGSVPVTASLTRSGGFTGQVNLTVTGNPAGVSAVVSNVQTVAGVTTATVTISADGNSTPGVYNLVLHGTGTGVAEATAGFTLTITPAQPTYVLIITNTPHILPGASGQATVSLVRANFTGNVTLALEGNPAGITGTFGTNPVSGTSSVLTINVALTVTPGTYNMTVRGTSTLTDRTAVFSVIVDIPGSFTLAIGPAGGVTMVQGTADNSKTINITRTNYTAAITFTAENLPAGLTAGFAPNPATTNGTVLTLTATAGLAPNTYDITIRGTGPAALRVPGEGLASVEATTTLAVTVTAAAVGNFTLTTTPATTAGVTQGGNTNVTININRTGGNTSNVALTITGTLPAGLTAVPSPASTTGNSSTLAIAATSAVAVGTYPIVIRGNATGLAEQTVNLNINVTAPGGSGNVTVDFSSCLAADRPVWLAFQNGTAAWQVVTGVNNAYSFTINAGKGGLTYVLLGGSGSSVVVVQYRTQAEWTAGPVNNQCGVTGGRTLTGTVAGMGSNDIGHVSFGNAQASVVSAAPNFTLNNAATGTHDLVIYTHPNNLVAALDRMGIWRDENPASTFGTRNMQTDPFSFLPAPAQITITGAGGGETFTHGMNYLTGTSCDFATLYFGMAVTGTQFNGYGAPAGMQRAGDRHNLTISGTTGTTMYRGVYEYNHDLTAHSVALGSQLPAGTVTETGTSYSILRKQFTAPVDLNQSFTWEYTQASAPRSAYVAATFGYFAGVNIDLRIGDYNGLAGWTNSWAPAAGLQADTYTGANGGNPTGSPCGAATGRLVFASLIATF